MTIGLERNDAEFARFISTHLPLRHLPELSISLHLAHPQSGLAHFLGPDGNTPYWAYPWAGGLALAHHIIANPKLVSGRTIVDFGAGSGLVGIVAARLGARAVMAVETDPLARRAIALNASANSVSIAAFDCVPAPGTIAQIDLILAGDVFYDQAVVAPVLAGLDRASATTVEVLIGDPGRAPLPRTRLQSIARYDVADVGRALGSPAEAHVYRLLKPTPQAHFDATFDS